MSDQKPHEILRLFFERKKKYSLRALARDLELSPSFVSGILNGKRPFPAKHLASFVQLLDIDFESEQVLKRKLNNFELAEPVSHNWQEEFTYLSVDKEKLLAHWYYPAMLELCALEKFDGDFTSALGITPYEAEIGIQNLTALGLIEKREGRFYKVVERVRYSSQKSRDAIRRFHKKMLDKAKEELDFGDEAFSTRYIGGVSLTINEGDIDYAREKVANFVNELSAELSQKPGDKVYHLAAQIFPVVRTEQSKD